MSAAPLGDLTDKALVLWQARLGEHRGDDLAEGLYESLMTAELAGRLEGLALTPDLRKVDEADVPHVLSRHVAEAVRRTLEATRTSEERLR